MQDMMKMYGMNGMYGDEGVQETLVLNAGHPLVQFVLAHKKAQSVPVICEQLYDLARISQHPLTQDEMTKFMKRSNEIMRKGRSSPPGGRSETVIKVFDLFACERGALVL